MFTVLYTKKNSPVGDMEHVKGHLFIFLKLVIWKMNVSIQL